MGQGEGQGEGSGRGGLCPGLLWGVLWFLILIFLGWPVAFFGVLRMERCEFVFDGLQGSNELILNGDQSEQWSHLMAHNKICLLLPEIAQLQQAAMSLVDEVSQVIGAK